MLNKLFIGAVVVAGLYGLGVLSNQDRLDAQAIHAMQVCQRAQHDHHVVVRSFDLQKCVDWNKVNDEDDDN